MLWLLPLLAFYPMTSFLFDYGALALLFALLGYAKRRALKQAKLFGLCVFALYGLMEAAFGDYGTFEIILMFAVLIPCWWMLEHFTLREIMPGERLPKLKTAGKFLARHSLYVYALHRAALQAMAMLR